MSDQLSTKSVNKFLTLNLSKVVIDPSSQEAESLELESYLILYDDGSEFCSSRLNFFTIEAQKYRIGLHCSKNLIFYNFKRHWSDTDKRRATSMLRSTRWYQLHSKRCGISEGQADIFNNNRTEYGRQKYIYTLGMSKLISSMRQH